MTSAKPKIKDNGRRITVSVPIGIRKRGGAQERSCGPPSRPDGVKVGCDASKSFRSQLDVGAFWADIDPERIEPLERFAHLGFGKPGY